MDIEYAKNEQIRSPLLLVIDENGEKMGELRVEDALFIAKNKGLDLVEVSPNAKPPVARILEWSKFKYQQDKKRKENKSRRIEQKEMWFKAFISNGDLDHKLRKVREFLKKKHSVKLTIRSIRGPNTRENMIQLIERIMLELQADADFESGYKFEGRNISVVARPTKSTKNININNDGKTEIKNT